MRDTTIYLAIIVLFSLPITTFAANNVNLISLDEPEQKELKDPRVSVDKKITLHKPQNKNKQQPPPPGCRPFATPSYEGLPLIHIDPIGGGKEAFNAVKGYLDLLAFGDYPNALHINSIPTAINDYASGERSSEYLDLENSLEFRLQYTQMQPFDFHNSFYNKNEFEKKDILLDFNQKYPLQMFSKWGKSLPREMYYAEKIKLDAYDHERKGFPLKYLNSDRNRSTFFYEDLVRALENIKPEKRTWSTLNTIHPPPDFWPISQDEAKRFFNKKNQQGKKKAVYILWLLKAQRPHHKLLANERGSLHLKAISAALYSDKSFQEKLVDFPVHSKKTTSIEKQHKQAGETSPLQNPPQGIAAISLPQLNGKPVYKIKAQWDTQYPDLGDGYTTQKRKHKIESTFANYINLAYASGGKDTISYSEDNRDGVDLKWSNLLTNEEKAKYRIIGTGASKYDRVGVPNFSGWKGDDTFRKMETALDFSQQYAKTISDWASRSFPEKVQFYTVLPVVIEYDFRKKLYKMSNQYRTSLREFYKLIKTNEWEVTWPKHYEFQVNAKEASDIAAKLTRSMRERSASAYSKDHYIAYSGMLLTLTPPEADGKNGTIEITEHGLYSDAYLTDPLTKDKAQNAPAVVSTSKISKKKNTRILHPGIIAMLIAKEFGLPDEKRLWVYLMALQFNQERKHETSSKYFPTDYRLPHNPPSPSEIPAKDVSKFKAWFVDQMETISPETTFILETKGPKRKNLRGEETAYAFADFPRIPKTNNESERKKLAATHSISPEQIFTVRGALHPYTTIVKHRQRRQLDIRDFYFIVPGDMKDYSFPINPQLLGGDGNGTTLVRAFFKLKKQEKNICFLTPVKIQFVMEKKVLKEITYSGKQL